MTGASRPTATTVGAGQRSPPGEKYGSIAVVDGGDELGPEAEPEQLLTGRLGRRDRRRPPVERRRQPGLEEAPGAGQRGGMIWSHIGPWTWWRIVMWGRRYHTGENHGTPFQTSIERVGAAHPPGQLGHHRAREHRVAAAPPDTS